MKIKQEKQKTTTQKDSITHYGTQLYTNYATYINAQRHVFIYITIFFSLISYYYFNRYEILRTRSNLLNRDDKYTSPDRIITHPDSEIDDSGEYI